MQKDDFRIGILMRANCTPLTAALLDEEATARFLSQFRLDFGILGINWASTATAHCWSLIITRCAPSAIIENSRHVMLVVDHSKFGRNAMVSIGSISMVNTVLYRCDATGGVMQVIKIIICS